MKPPGIFIHLLTCLILSSGFSPKHAFYVSITDVSYEEEFGEFQCKSKLFTNDLEDALAKKGYGKLHLNTPQESTSSEIAIAAYLQSNIAMKTDQGILSFTFIKKEYVDDACWIYYQTSSACELSTLSIKNQVLMELFDTQVNIIRLKANGKRQTANLEKQLPFKKFNF